MGKVGQMMIEVCKNCGKEFEKSKKHKLGNFCSNKCSVEYRKWNNEPNCKCPTCGIEFYIKQSQIDKSKTTCCSKSCSNKFKSITFSKEGNHQFGLKGKLNASFKTDELFDGVYLKVYCGEKHPFADAHGRILKHRYVAEKYLLSDYNSIVIEGIRYLNPDFAVHHLDLNKTNNNLDNLIVLTHSQHTYLHNLIKLGSSGK